MTFRALKMGIWRHFCQVSFLATLQNPTFPILKEKNVFLHDGWLSPATIYSQEF